MRFFTTDTIRSIQYCRIPFFSPFSSRSTSSPGRSVRAFFVRPPSKILELSTIPKPLHISFTLGAQHFWSKWCGKLRHGVNSSAVFSGGRAAVLRDLMFSHKEETDVEGCPLHWVECYAKFRQGQVKIYLFLWCPRFSEGRL